jgi:hypothetical protein
VFWEVFSNGEHPYAFIEEDVRTFLYNGQRLPCPVPVLDENSTIYQLMKQCWKENPKER